MMSANLTRTRLLTLAAAITTATMTAAQAQQPAVQQPVPTSEICVEASFFRLPCFSAPV